MEISNSLINFLRGFPLWYYFLSPLAFYFALKLNKWRKFPLLLVSNFWSKKSNFTVCDTRKAASLTYDRLGKKYLLYLPYDSRLMARMSGHQALLIKDGIEIDITQQPGIPYLVTATELGGSEIKILHRGHEYRFEADQKIESSIFSSLE